MLNVSEAEGAGNLSDLTKSLSEEAATLAASASPAPGKEKQATEQPATPDEDIPEKFKGKSVKEIVDSYKQLESQYGRMANDLGQQRHLTDRLLNLKRENDLSANGGTPRKVEIPQIKATDLADNPSQAIDQVVQARLAAKEQEQQMTAAELARQAAAQRLVADHPDYQNYVNNQEFMTWVQGSALRRSAASRAQAGDFDEGNALLTEFKEHKKAVSRQTEESNLEGARKASLESGSRGAGAEKGQGKTYRRADLLELQMTNPDKYYSDDFQRVILKAYAEGRVK